MYGATKEPEIRASSIKGLLRYWWRMFHYDGNVESLKDLKEKEEKIFGSTNGRSPVQIRVKKIIQKFARNNEFPQKNIEKKDGLNYLFYFMKAGQNVKKSYIKEGGKFEIEFRYKEEEIAKEYLEALNWLQKFGGMGSRNRRGAGNFKILDISGDEGFKNKLDRCLIVDFENRSINHIYNNEICKDKVSVYRFKNEQKDDCKGEQKNKKETELEDKWIEVLNALGKKYKDFRDVKKNYIYKRFQSERKAIFGVPIIGKPKTDKVTKIKRMESPLIFKVIEVEKEKYECIVIRVHSSPLEREDELKVENKSIIDLFLQSDDFEKIYEVKEVDK